MPIPDESLLVRAAAEWTDVPTDPAEMNYFFQEVILPSAYHSRLALGALATGQEYFSDSNENSADDIAFIYPHPLIPRTTENEPFYTCLTNVCYGFTWGSSVDRIAELGYAVLIRGQFKPPPELLGELLAASRFKKAIEDLAIHSEVFSTTWGLGYVSLNRATSDSVITLGCANPFTGRRVESSFDLAPLKETYGFPYPQPPEHVWRGNRVDHS